jgi:hypothetical protein
MEWEAVIKIFSQNLVVVYGSVDDQTSLNNDFLAYLITNDPDLYHQLGEGFVILQTSL